MCIAGIYQKEPAMPCEWWLGAWTRGTTALLVSPELCLASGWWLKLKTSGRQTPKQLHRATYFGLKATWVKNGLTSMGWILSCIVWMRKLWSSEITQPSAIVKDAKLAPEAVPSPYLMHIL